MIPLTVPRRRRRATQRRSENDWATDDPGFEAAEASATIDQLLNTLSERDRLVLRLRFREDLTQSEIGRRIGCSQMHVSRILRGALAQLVQNATTPAGEPNAPGYTARYEEHWAQTAVA